MKTNEFIIRLVDLAQTQKYSADEISQTVWEQFRVKKSEISQRFDTKY